MGDDTLARLTATIAARRDATATSSYTKSLLDKGIAACAKKLGEEAAETLIAAVAKATRRCATRPPILSIICLCCWKRATFLWSRCRASWIEGRRNPGLPRKLRGQKRECVMSLQEVLEFDPRPALEPSPYRTFTRHEWSELRNGVHLSLTEEDWRGCRALSSASAKRK